MTDELSLDETLEELVSAEDFLTYFGVPFDASVVHVSRLHILQRYHDYLSAEGEPQGDDTARYAGYKALLEKAYGDFVTSTPLDEKVFKVFHMHEPQTGFVSVADLLGGTQPAAPAGGSSGGAGTGSSCGSAQLDLPMAGSFSAHD
jgi:nitrogenase-stabilizing/protective protein